MTQALPELVEEFLLSVRAEGRSYKTIDIYGLPLRKFFLPWCEAEGISEAAQLTEPGVLDRFAVVVNGRRKASGQIISPNSARTYLKSLRQFLGWLNKAKGIEARGARPPKLRKKVIDPLTDGDMAKLLQAANSERDKLILEVMAATGAREGEIANLRTADLVSRDRHFFLRLKGKTGERLCPLTDVDLAHRLQTHIRHGRGRKLASDHLFMASRAAEAGGDRASLSTSGIYHMVKSVAREAGLTKRVYPHLFRHTAVTQMLRDGLDSMTVSDITGVSLQVIKDVYSHLLHEDHWEALHRARKGSTLRRELAD